MLSVQYPELYDGHNAFASSVYSLGSTLPTLNNKHGATGDDDDPLISLKGCLILDRANLSEVLLLF